MRKIWKGTFVQQPRTIVKHRDGCGDIMEHLTIESVETTMVDDEILSASVIIAWESSDGEDTYDYDMPVEDYRQYRRLQRQSSAAAEEWFRGWILDQVEVQVS